MPQLHAEVLQILLSQVGENREVNRILGETFGVFSETDSPQPFRDPAHRTFRDNCSSAILAHNPCARRSLGSSVAAQSLLASDAGRAIWAAAATISAPAGADIDGSRTVACIGGGHLLRADKRAMLIPRT